MANKVVIPVKVAVRCRPFSEKEKAEGSQNCVEFYVEHNQLAVGEKMFAYDFVFDQTTSQDDVYEQCALPLLESMRGLTRLSSLRSDKPALRYHATIFAYGQTGSGKTHTMGTEVVADTMTDQQRGIVSRIVQAIFDRIAAQTTDQVKYTASCSMLEIYEDRVIDLLSGSKTDNLPIREADGKVFVQGLSNHAIADLRSTIGKLKIGCENRSKGGTAMNLHSSRSHAIFTITVNQTVDGVDDKQERTVSFSKTNWIAKLNLVDLAGSENLKKTKAAGERKKEDSLGGSSYTLMIACISPADTNCGETLSTLRYAERAKRIKNKPIVNQDPQAAQILNLKREVAELKRRCTSLEHENDEKQMKMIEERMDLTQQLATFECRRDQSIDVVKAIESKLKPYLSEQPECNGCDDKVITIKSVHAELPKIFEEHEQDDQEQTTAQMMTTTSAADDESTDEEDDATATKEHKTNWVERTSALTTDLQSILTDIRCKEQLAEDMTNAYERQEQLSATRQKEVTELQQQVDRLQSERDELDRQLRTISNQQKSDKMIFCDVCDRGYHTFCVGRWVCTTFCAAEQPPPSAAEKLKTEGGGDSGRSTPVGDPIGTCESCQCTITKVNKVHHRSKYRNDGICTSCARQKQANREPPSRPVEPPEKVKKVDDTADGDDEENQDQKPPAVMEPTMSESTKSVVALAVTTALPTTTTATTTAVTVNQNTAATTTPTTIGGATTTTTTANPVPKPMEMPATQSTHKMPGAASRPSDDVDMASIDDVIGTVISSGVRLPDQVN